MDQYFHFTVLYSDIRIEEQQIGLAQQVICTAYQHNPSTLLQLSITLEEWTVLMS